MKMVKRMACLLLCAVLLLSGCGVLETPPETTTDGGDDTTSSTQGNITPVVPSNPVVPSDPVDPSQPDPSDPSDDPQDPSQPTEPDQPTDPDTPSDPTKPTDPDKPSTPVNPSNPNQPSKPNPIPTPDDGYVDIGVDPLPCPEEELFTQLFDLNNKITVNLDMSAAELEKLQKDYEHYRGFNSKSPIYRMGNLIISITTSVGTTKYRISEVGVRMKGNTSRTDFYNDHDGIYKYIHLKLDFQETFDDPNYYGNSVKNWTEEGRKERKDRTFATLEQLEMRWNKCYDPTYLKETYAYAMYRTEGVMAPLTNLCSFDWSKTHMGVYTIYEPVDKVFLEKRLPEGEADGDLYKCGWTDRPCDFTNTHSIGIENEDKGEFYCFDLKNNKKTSDHSALKNLINTLNSGSLTKEKLAQLVDIDNFLSYVAVSYFLGNPDDLRHNYNNFYLYFVPSTGQALFIPYDYDRCLGITFEWNPTGNGVTEDNPFGEAIAAGGNQRNPLMINTIVKGGFYVKEYSEVLKRVAGNSLLKNETFESWFSRANRLYGSNVQPSKNLYNAEGRQFAFSLNDGIGGNLSFRTYITKKMATYNRYMSRLDGILDYERPEQIIYYIRGEFNGWSDRPEYGMKMKDGKASITLTITNNNSRFKVYNQPQQLWYGTNDISPDTTAEYSSAGNHDNILLKPGKYLIVFDTETKQITITPA